MTEKTNKSMKNDFVIKGKKLKRYKGTAKVAEIPESIEIINSKAFLNCEVEKIIISGTIRKIERGAFSNCPNLEGLFQANEEKYPEMKERYFENCPKVKMEERKLKIDWLW